MEMTVELLISSFVGGLIGLVLGVVLEDLLVRFRDKFLDVIRRPFRNRLEISAPFHFSFGPIETTEIVVDGDGESEYTPSTIICHYDPTEIVLPPELQEIRDRIEAREERKKQTGESYMWNGKRYALKRFIRGRTDDEEHLEINLWFGPSDFFSYCATTLSLDSEYVFNHVKAQRSTLREKYLVNIDPSSPSLQPIPFFWNSFGVNASLISKDRQLIIMRRSQEVSSWKGMYHIAINEGLHRPFDRSDISDAPNLYRAVIRGAAEELGLELDVSNITFLTFNVNAKYLTWSIQGMARTEYTAQEIVNMRKLGAKDRWEAMEIIPVDFDVKKVIEFIHSCEPWSPHGLSCIYYTLVHEFGKKAVEEGIRKYML
jgi:hypothetical protein